jgi:hypothetical protein
MMIIRNLQKSIHAKIGKGKNLTFRGKTSWKKYVVLTAF